jgi:hypothetical protein
MNSSSTHPQLTAETGLSGWERSPYRTGLRPIIPANREKYREIYKNRPGCGVNNGQNRFIQRAFRSNSLTSRTGNCWRESRQVILENREFLFILALLLPVLQPRSWPSSLG